MCQIIMALWLQPHADDVAISSGWLLWKRVLRAMPHLVTVFSLSGHANKTAGILPMCEVTRRRINEDETFCRKVGARYQGLGFEDECLIADLSPLVQAIRRRLLGLTIGRLYACVVCSFPYGPATHIHHLAVFSAAWAVAESLRVPLLLTDDVPYSKLPRTRPIWVNGREYVPRLLDLSAADLVEKKRLMGIYETQICDRYYQAVSATAPGDSAGAHSESIWVPADRADELGSSLRNPLRQTEGAHACTGMPHGSGLLVF